MHNPFCFLGNARIVLVSQNMSKQRKKVVVQDDSEEDMEVEDETQTQTLTQAQRVTASLSKELINNMISEVVQYMLIMEQKKLPIKRADINKHVLKENSRAYTEIFRQAREKLKSVFGLEVTELELPGAKSKKNKVYILLNTLDAGPQADYVDMSLEEPRMSLLLIVLSIIFMNQGEVITDALLWNILKKLDIKEDQEHEVFGDVKKILTTDFTKQLYLEYTRIQNSAEVQEYEFRWGLRAHKEISKRKILEFVCKVYGDKRPEDWNTQYKEVIRSEGGREEQETAGTSDA